MAQGTRGRWIRAATTGFGVLLCTGLVGCMNWDKPKDTKATKQPTPGLPGTQTLPPSNGATANTKMGQPGAAQPFNGAGANIQPAGGFGTTNTNTNTNTPPRFGSTGQNTNTSAPAQQYGNYPPGTPGMIGSPTTPGVSVQPVGGPVGAAPSQNFGTGVSFSSPPPPSLDNIPLPPVPPGAGAGRGEYASGPIQPPTPGPISPPPTPPGAPTYPGKGGF